MSTKHKIDTGAAFDSDVAQTLADPETKQIFEREYANAMAIATLLAAVETARVEQKLTTAEVARRIGRERSAVARLLRGESEKNPTLDTCSDLLYAVGLQADVRIRPAAKSAKKVTPLKVLVS